MISGSGDDGTPADPLAGRVARASFEHALDAMLLADDERRYTDANPAACSLLDLPYEEVVSRRLDDFVPEEARPSLDGAWRDFLDSGTQSGELELLVADGSRRMVEFRATARVLPGCHLSVLRDISERHRAELDREREREFLDAVLESLDAGVVACGPDGALSLFNRATREMHGMPAEALSPEDWAGRYGLFRPDGRTPMEAEDVPLLRALRGERVRDAELVIVPQDRPPRTLLCNGRAIERRDGRSLGAVVAMHDVTERRRAEEQLAHQALHDPLTGLPNRALLRDRVEQALERSNRDSSTVGVLFLDLDDFALISHSRGHVAGERLLVQVGARLENTLRSTDTAAQLIWTSVCQVGVGNRVRVAAVVEVGRWAGTPGSVSASPV